MTVDQIVWELEGLKDYTNDHGKGVLELLKGEVRKLTEKPEPPVVVPPAVVPKAAVVVEAPKPPKPEVFESLNRPAVLVKLPKRKYTKRK